MAIPIRVGQVGPSKSVAKANRKSQDPRLWLGILFILAAMIIGQLVVSNASARVPAVTLNSNIAQGSLIRESDVTSVQVSVPNVENLISYQVMWLEKLLVTDLFAGDLISIHSISNGFASDARNVSVPIRAGHFLKLAQVKKLISG
jgi:hypothetical protein